MLKTILITVTHALFSLGLLTLVMIHPAIGQEEPPDNSLLMKAESPPSADAIPEAFEMDSVGIDSSITSGRKMYDDAANIEGELKELSRSYEITRKRNIWKYWMDDGYLFIENHDKYQLTSPLLSDTSRSKPRLRSKIGARLQFDFSAFNTDNAGMGDFNNDISLRRGRIYSIGEYLFIIPTAYKFQFAFTESELFLSDFFFRLENIPFVGNLQIGKFKAPFSLERLQSSFDLALMEYAAPVEAFSPGNKTGMQIDWSSRGNRVLLQVGVFTDLDDYVMGDATEDSGRLQFRAVWIPWAHGVDTNRNCLHVGVAISEITTNEGQSVRYRARPESRNAPVLVDTGNLNADWVDQINIESIWSKGSFYLMGEVTASHVNQRDGSETVTFWGAYLTANYILTGEVVPYDPKQGILKAIKPANPLKGIREGTGSWELSGRLSFVDLSDGNIQGGRMAVLTGGVNWHWNKHVKWMANLGYAEVTGGVHNGNVIMGQLRLQIKY